MNKMSGSQKYMLFQICTCLFCLSIANNISYYYAFLKQLPEIIPKYLLLFEAAYKPIEHCAATIKFTAGLSDFNIDGMPPRQDFVAQPQRIRVEQARPPPPPAPGRLQRPPHDNPTVYINRPSNMTRNNVNRS